MSSSLNGTGLTFSSGATLNSPPVTSIATGNGLSGGTITTTGTIAIACPTQNTVGSYAIIGSGNTNNGGDTYTFGSNYAAGNNFTTRFVVGIYGWNASTCGMSYTSSNSAISGTWKWLGPTGTGQYAVFSLGCRVA